MIDESLLTNRFVEFHDASVVDAIQKDGWLTICLHAFVHDDIKRDDGAGVWQRIDLKLKNAAFECIHDAGEENWTIDGSLDVDDAHYRNGVPIPFEATGAVSISLVGDDEFSFTAKGTRVALAIAGPAMNREAPKRKRLE